MKGAARLPAAILLVSGLIGAAACASRQPAVPERPLAPVEAAPGWFEEGIASWYGGGDGFDGKPTASGEIYDAALLTAAHRELALGTVVDVLRVDTGQSVRVRINDRGPFVKGRVVDLSKAAAAIGSSCTGSCAFTRAPLRRSGRATGLPPTCSSGSRRTPPSG